MNQRAALAMTGLLTLAIFAPVAGAGTSTEELPARAVAAFDRYVELASARFRRQVDEPNTFLDLRTWEGDARSEARRRFDDGDAWVRSLRKVDREMAEIDAGDGIIHHWAGTAWIPGATLEAALEVSRDFAAYPELYEPEVVTTRTIERAGPADFRVYMRFRKKKVITVTIDTEQRIRFFRPAASRAYSVSEALWARQIEDAGERDERHKPAADGFLWDLYNTWRFEESDGGLYVEHESVILTRKPPFLMRLVAGSMISDGPREGVEFALEALRRRLEAR